MMDGLSICTGEGLYCTFCDMRTVVVCLDAAGRIVDVDVEGVQMSADLFYGREVLDNCGAGFEDLRFSCFGVAGGIILGSHL